MTLLNSGDKKVKSIYYVYEYIVMVEMSFFRAYIKQPNIRKFERIF